MTDFVLEGGRNILRAEGRNLAWENLTLEAMHNLE